MATLEASLTRKQNLQMHGELLKAIDIPAEGAAAKHSYKKFFMQYCGAECEATLREPYLNANYQVQNFRQFVCELEQKSQVRKLNVVTHLRSESQLDQLERLKGRSTAHRDRVPVQRRPSRTGARSGQQARRGMRSGLRHAHQNTKRYSADHDSAECLLI